MMFSENHLGQFLTAIHFSAEKHRHQRRKDPDASPYINHPIQVAELLWRVGQIRDVSVIIAAVLHDTIEDTETSSEEIASQFGEDILSVVLEVTDDKSLPKSERKRLQIEHASMISPKAKLIKLADKTCNVRDVTYSPPRGWNLERRVEYLDWTEKVVNGLRGVNPTLEAYYDQILKEGRSIVR